VIQLPRGLRSRPLQPGDAEVVTALIAACELQDDGVAEIAVEDVVADWSRPGVFLDDQSTAVLDGERLVAVGNVYHGRAEVDVHPEYRGRGIGSSLMRWTWDVARADGRRDVGQTVTDHRADAAALFRSHGYHERWTSWILEIRMDEEPPAATLPKGYAIREFVPGEDDRAVYDVVDTAFNEWPDREGESFDVWQAWMSSHGSLAPWASPVVTFQDAIVGAAIGFDYGPDNEGWIQQLAVERRHRGVGLGRALLQDSFRRFYAAGRRRCGVNTDSRAGALTLYEHVGMHVRRSYTRWSKQLT
jgi:GNAT superfamily N-acetyltransferase